MPSKFLEDLGGAAGCLRLAQSFYARVGRDPVLRPLFPGKTLRCATEEFAAFLVQFLDGEEAGSEHRWWLSLRASHARFRIDAGQRAAWLRHMAAALDEAPISEETRRAMGQFFTESSRYVIGQQAGAVEDPELAARWTRQESLDELMARIAAGDDAAAVAQAPRFAGRPAVFAGVLARMMEAGRPELVEFVVASLESDPDLCARRFAGRSLLHFAAGAGCVPVVELLLRQGMDPNLPDRGGHPPLYRVANECATGAGVEVVRQLVRAGADVNAHGGVTRATPLHMAARRGFVEIARVLIECGAMLEAPDRKGVTPWRRAVQCRKPAVAQLLLDHGARR